MTLKVGDKVKTHWGDVGEVVAVRDPGGYFDVKIPGRHGPSSVTPGASTYHESVLEKIEDPAPRFKVGDRVRLLARTWDNGTHVVSDVTDGFVYVDGRLASSREGWLPANVEKVESVPFKLERGDKVVNRKTGREGFVSLGMVHDLHAPFKKPVSAKAVEGYEELHPGTYDLIKKDAPW